MEKDEVIRDIDDALRFYHTCMGQDPRRLASERIGLQHRRDCLAKARQKVLSIQGLAIVDINKGVVTAEGKTYP